MKKDFRILLIAFVTIFLVAIVSAGFFDSLTGKATRITSGGNVLNLSGLFVNNAYLGIGKSNTRFSLLSVDSDGINFNADTNFEESLIINQRVNEPDAIKIKSMSEFATLGFFNKNGTRAGVIGLASQPENNKLNIYGWKGVSLYNSYGGLINIDEANVGIGTAGPKARLHVLGNVLISNSSTTEPKAKLHVIGNALISNLAGIGNSYVCVDSQGVLFRSNSPCTRLKN